MRTNVGQALSPVNIAIQTIFSQLLSDVSPIGFTDTATHNFTIPSTSVFHLPSQAFSSNPRSITLSAMIVF